MNNTQNNYKQLGEYMNDKTTDLLRQAYEALQFSMEDHECVAAECTDCDLLLKLESELGAVPPYVAGIAFAIGYTDVFRPIAGRYDFMGGDAGCPAVFQALPDRIQIAFDTRDGGDSLSFATLSNAGLRLRNEWGVGTSVCTVYAHEGRVYVEVSDA